MESRAPLDPLCILTTRAEVDDGQPLQSLLREAGAEVVALPQTEFVPLQQLPGSLLERPFPRFDWLLFTSQNGVRFFFDACAQHELEFDPRPQIGAVGEATAATLASFGWHVDSRPAEFTGAALAEALGEVQARRILLPRARLGRADLVDSLIEQGGRVVDWPLYDTRCTPAMPEALEALPERLDVIIFTSPEAVNCWQAQHITLPSTLSAQLQQLREQAAIAVIGPTTRTAVEKYGWPVAIQPEIYTFPALVEAIAAWAADK